MWGQDGRILAKFFFCSCKKRTRPISSHLDRTDLANKGFIIWFLRDTAGSPERARWLHLARSGSQSQRAIWVILPARGASQIIGDINAFFLFLRPLLIESVQYIYHRLPAIPKFVSSQSEDLSTLSVSCTRFRIVNTKKRLQKLMEGVLKVEPSQNATFWKRAVSGVVRWKRKLKKTVPKNHYKLSFPSAFSSAGAR